MLLGMPWLATELWIGQGGVKSGGMRWKQVIGGLYKLGREESTWRVEGRGELSWQVRWDELEYSLTNHASPF